MTPKTADPLVSPASRSPPLGPPDKPIPAPNPTMPRKQIKPAPEPDDTPPDLDLPEALEAPARETLQLPTAPDIVPPTLADIPPALLTGVPPRHQRLAVRIYQGASWEAAAKAEGYGTKKTPGRPTQAATERIQAIIDAMLAEFSDRASMSKRWCRAQLVSLYQYGSRPWPLYDRAGKVIGDSRPDIAAARGCIELLGRDIGMFGRDQGSVAVGDVAQLLAAVASHGRPLLPGDRARVVVDQPSDTKALPIK